MPTGAVNVTFKVNVPESDCVGAVLRKNDPKLLLPLRAPPPSAVVPVKCALPVKVNWGTPVTVPVVEPERVTSSALASLWARVRKASATRQRKSDLPAVRMPNFSISDSSLERGYTGTWDRRGAGGMAGQCRLLGLQNHFPARLRTG